MASSSTTIAESTLLSELQSSTPPPLFPLFSTYLTPFTTLNTSNSDKTSRSLAKQFLPFLNKSISLLRKRLSSPSPPLNPHLAIDLFDVYRLLLDCLDLISNQLSCKPHAVYEQRVNLLCCLKICGFYEEGVKLGFWVLGKVKGLEFTGLKRCEKKGEFVAEFGKGRDAELVRLVVDVIRLVVECVAAGKSKERGEYLKVVKLVEEGLPWFSAIEASTYEKLHRALVTNLGKTTIFLVEELMNFGGDVVCAFCSMTLNMHACSSKKDQIFKFVRQISSMLFLLQDDSHPDIINVLRCILDNLCNICKVEVKRWETEFVEFVSYCAHKCRTASAIFCSAIAEYLNILAGSLCQVMKPLELIIRLYATGLCYSNNVIRSGLGDSMPSTGRKDGLAVGALLDGTGLCNLAPLLNSLRTYVCSDNKENCMECDDLTDRSCSHSISDFNASSINMEKRKKAYLLAYINVLKFLCEPLAELVNSEKKQVVNEADAASVSNVLYDIQNTFHQFCDVAISYYSSCTSIGENVSDGHKVIPSVAVAAFTLSIRTKVELQKSVLSLEQIITSKWIQLQALKYMFVSLYNIGVILYRNDNLNEASKALNLSHMASWACVAHFCQMLTQKSNDFNGDCSEEQVVNFITEACARTAFVLDVLDQCESHKVKNIILESLEKWSVAENLLGVLPGPISLVKKWVKIQCKLTKNAADYCAPILYSLLSSSTRASTSAIEKILEQELFVYEEMGSMYPGFSQRMQMKTLNNLLQEVYVTQDSYLQKSRILISKGRAFRAHGFEGLKDCLECLSEAIFILKQNSETCYLGAPTCHQLAVAHCLRALCTYEAEPNSKQLLEDIQEALRVWLRIPVVDYDSVYSDCRMLPNGVLLLLYNMIDLLSAMGLMEFHHDMYELMIRLFEWKNIPMEKWLPRLWDSRRLSHALCVSPINDLCTTNLSLYYSEQFKSMEFWLSCLRGSSPSLVGFQQIFSYLLTSSHDGPANSRTSCQSDVTINNVKEAAIELISTVPVPSASAFFAGCLYYDLSERLVSSGRLYEALSYAQEAHRLRTRLFQEKFLYSVEHRVEKHSVIGHRIHNLQVNKSFAVQAWPSDTISLDLEACYLSSWKVLQCYLESTLQVGVINEIIGNGVEAEAYLLWGKDISCKQNLPLFSVSFSSVLGQLYRKKQSWDLSEKELLYAKQIVEKQGPKISCLKCRLILQVAVDQQLGDLHRSQIFGVTKKVSVERLVQAESLFKSALDKLNLSEWKNSLICPSSLEEGEGEAENLFNVSAMNQQDAQDFAVTKLGTKAKIDRRKCRKPKNVTASLMEQSSTTEVNKRVTRSRYRSSHSSADIAPSNHSEGKSVSDIPDAIIGKDSSLTVRSEVHLGCGIACNGNNLNCWFCLVKQVKKSGSLSNSIHLKWEFVRRKHALRALISIGKCLEAPGQIGEKHDIIVQSLSALVFRNPFIRTVPPLPLTSLIDVIGNEALGDAFAVERAALLLNLCLFSLKVYNFKDARIICCDLCNIQLQKVVSLLMVAFILCREVSTLFQKVSRLLSVIFVLSSSNDLPTSLNKLSASHWASFFHQASIGTHLNNHLFSHTGRCKSQPQGDDQVKHRSNSFCIGEERLKLSRLSPCSVQDMEKLVADFFTDLPCTTIISISLIGGPCASLLEGLLGHPSRVCSWMLLSRFNLKTQPIVMLLPVVSVSVEALDVEDSNSDSGKFFNNEDLEKRWHCPWGLTIVDEVAPTFKLILEENYSSSISPLEDTKENRAFWWARRKKIDSWLGQFLRNLEDLWFGPWRYVLLGQWSNCKNFDAVQKKLVRDLKLKSKLHVNESFLEVILGGAGCDLDEETCYLQLLSLKNGCYIGKGGLSDEERCGETSVSAVQLLGEALNELRDEDPTNRDPVILVLDFDVQMLPWENLPILRNQEVYRMPSVGSIFLTLERNCKYQEQGLMPPSPIPFIDPLDAFYLLNPSGDLGRTQVEFEKWFRDQNFEGKAGSSPAVEELALALKSHDLFIYFGHGSGAQYISTQEIQKLEKCAATCLMGCSSGSLLLNGCYVPQGTPLSYLLAGSPVIVANLWEVTDRDIDRFAKALLDAWLKERCCTSGCSKCDLLVKEFEAMTIRGGKGNAKNKVTKKKGVKDSVTTGSLLDCCDHRPKIASFISQARNACALPYIIGASPICYGVPTAIRRKKELQQSSE